MFPLGTFFLKQSKKIRIPGTNGLTLYDLLELYGTGIVKGTFSSRASAIAYSFFYGAIPIFVVYTEFNSLRAY